LKNEIQNYEDKAVEIAERLAKNRTLPDPQKISHEQLKEEYKKLEKEHQEQIFLIEAGKIEIINKNNRLNSLNNDIQNLKSEISGLEQKLSTKRGEICGLEKKINELKLVMDRNEQEINNLKEEINRLEAEKQRLENKISEIREENKIEVNKLIDEKSELGSQLIKKISEAEQAKIDIGQLEGKILGLKNTIDSKDRELEG